MSFHTPSLQLTPWNFSLHACPTIENALSTWMFGNLAGKGEGIEEAYQDAVYPCAGAQGGTRACSQGCVAQGCVAQGS